MRVSQHRQVPRPGGAKANRELAALKRQAFLDRNVTLFKRKRNGDDNDNQGDINDSVLISSSNENYNGYDRIYNLCIYIQIQLNLTHPAEPEVSKCWLGTLFWTQLTMAFLVPKADETENNKLATYQRKQKKSYDENSFV